MSYYSFCRCGLLLALLPRALAVREGDGAVSLLQLDTKAGPRPWSLTSTARTERTHLTAGELLENSAVLHIPYAKFYNHIANNVTYNNFFEQILTFPQRRPREFNVILATCKTWTADAIVQFGERRGGQTWRFDWSRSAAFAIFGFLYIGCMQWILYVTVLTWLFPDAMAFANSPLAMKLQDQEGMIDMVGQICVDNFIFEVLIYFPVFYMIKSVMTGKDSLTSRIQTGLSKYWTNIIPDNLASFAVWIPADVVIFACPMYLRMPMEHCVSFGWTMFISATRGASESKDKADQKFSEI